LNVAKEVRLRRGTITVPDLVTRIRGQFALRHHPDFVRDWETLLNVTEDHKARIETQLPSGYALPRAAQSAALQKAVAENPVTVVFGESGTGKSALVKSSLDHASSSWNQVWFEPETLTTALSAAKRNSLPLQHELSLVLNATVHTQNVLVLDSAERIEAGEFVVIGQLLQAILPKHNDTGLGAWRVVIITQTQGWLESQDTLLGGRPLRLVEVDALTTADVKLALRPLHNLGWLSAHDATIAALTNLRTLAWVIRAGTALGPYQGELADHTAVADWLWRYWTKDLADVQALIMRLGDREASFERSFALTDLEQAELVTFRDRPKELPLRLNARTNRIEFEHDLAADWARYQYLKQISTNTSKWFALAGNPLWTNALRTLGQLLLRQPVGAVTAWDVAFGAAEATNDELATDILLDAICLDPKAEKFLSDRVELLIGNNAKNLTRLLTRFLHIATVPTRLGVDLEPDLGLYFEAQYRSLVVGRWPPVLRFLDAQRARLAALVSPAIARVIEAWLTKMPHAFSDGTRMPFRREMAQLALEMARTVQAEKGRGVAYLTHEPSLYTAPLAGIVDLPLEVGDWALEMAGRRDVDSDVKRRISKARLREPTAHAERLKTDAIYNARHEKAMRMSPSLGSMRERLPHWPLGASEKVDSDFRTACIKGNGLRLLMSARPELAAKVLLALIIEDEPERDYHRNRYEVDLGLEYSDDAYPTVFWKSPFFTFLQLSPAAALQSLIALVNFCTERWVDQVMAGRNGDAPRVTLQFADQSVRTYLGGWQVFSWPQSHESWRNGHLFCALDALERWLALRIDAHEDITSEIDNLLRDGNSLALISVLVNVAKYRPSMVIGPLAPLLTYPRLFVWDSQRVQQVGFNFIAMSWVRYGEAMFNIVRDWTLAPHRKRTFLDVVVELLPTEDVVARRLQELIPTWDMPEDAKEALEFKLLYASLDRANYKSVADPSTGAATQRFVCPAQLGLEVRSWQSERAPALAYSLLPDRCKQRLQAGQPLTDDDANYLADVVKECDAGPKGVDEATISSCRLAAIATLITLGGAWLARNADVQARALYDVRESVASMPSTRDEIRTRRISGLGDDMTFTAYAVTQLWLNDTDSHPEWETALLKLLTSGDQRAAGVVVNGAYVEREQLGPAWWRLLWVGLLWSGLIMLTPQDGDGSAEDHVWSVWLARLRRLPIRGCHATPDDLNFGRIAAGQERLEFHRRMRLFNDGKRAWQGKPQHRLGGSLDDQFLGVLFFWLIEGDGTGNQDIDMRLATRMWEYEARRAKADQSSDEDDYDLPGQSLGYNTLSKLAALSVAAPLDSDHCTWEPVLRQGPAAHYAVQHFIRCLFMRLKEGDDPKAFERVWRAIVEYGLAADWFKPGLWFKGERLICDLLGFGNEDALSQCAPGAANRMKDVYEQWAAVHLARDEECISRFCHFLASDFGAQLRLYGLRWIAAATLQKGTPSSGWYRDSTGAALVNLAAATLGSDKQTLAQDAQSRQALLDITAALVARNIPAALSLQERIKQIR
jgi:hypothetical protein